MLEFLLPLLCGAKVLIASQAECTDGHLLGGLLKEKCPTLMQATPSTWRMLIESGWSGSDTLTCLCGGEALPVDLAFQMLLRSSRLINVYGPTETTIWSTFNIVEDATDTTIGCPLHNQWVFVLDQNKKLSPPHIPGELWIGGLGVSTGYLNDKLRTSERFVANNCTHSLEVLLHGHQTNSMIYRTGDVVRWNQSGNLEFIGRCDRQTKVNGFRVELEAVEAALATGPGVLEVIVQIREVGQSPHLVAYFRSESTDAIDLEFHARNKLPAHMCPSFYVSLSEFPKTPNNKVDKNRLPSPETALQRSKSDETKLTHDDELAYKLWSEVLGVDTSTSSDLNFSQLGGNSLQLSRLRSKIRNLVGDASFDAAAISTLHTVETLRDLLLSRYRIMQYDDARDALDVKEFIRQNWDSQHPLSIYHDLFAWQYKVGSTDSEAEFLVVRNMISSATCAIFGVTPQRFQGASKLLMKSLSGGETSMWMVRSESQGEGLGSQMLRHLQDRNEVLVCMGLNRQTAVPIFSQHGFKVLDVCRHVVALDVQGYLSLVRLNDSDTSCAAQQEMTANGSFSKWKNTYDDHSHLKLKIVHHRDAPFLAALWKHATDHSGVFSLVRDERYWKWRYFETPGTFEYIIFTDRKDSSSSGLVVVRVEQIRSQGLESQIGLRYKRALRIIECVPASQQVWREGIVDVGFSALLSQVLAWSQEQGCIVADFYCTSVRISASVQSCGFILEPSVPKLFSNATHKVGELNFGYWVRTGTGTDEPEDLYFVKSTGDMDRPVLT